MSFGCALDIAFGSFVHRTMKFIFSFVVLELEYWLVEAIAIIIFSSSFMANLPCLGLNYLALVTI